MSHPVPFPSNIFNVLNKSLKGLTLLLIVLWSSPGSAQAPYCDPDYSTGCGSFGDQIDDFTLENVSRIGSGCSPGDYEFYTADTIWLQRSVNYTMTVASGDAYNEGIASWMDYDQNQSFFESGEFLGSGIAGSAGTPFDISFQVPMSADTGYTRLRIRCDYNAAPTAGDSCSTITYGEAEDYVVHIDTAPSCQQPFPFTANTLNADSIELSWTSNAGGSEWQIEYGPSGFAQGNGTDTLLSTVNPDTVSGLMPNTEYDFYIREICGAGDTSYWSGPASATTPCVAATAPFFQDFDSSAVWDPNNGDISQCWMRNPDNTTDYSWRTNTGGTGSGGTGPDGDHPSGNGNYVYTEGSDGGGNEIATLTTIPIDLSAMSDPELRFFYHFYGAEIDSFKVAIDSGNGFENVDTIIGEQQTANSDLWLERTVDLNAYLGNTIEIRFSARRGGGFASDYALDNVQIWEKPTCPRPDSVNATALNGDSVEVDWNSNASGTEWIIEYGPAGFTPGNGTTMISTGSPDTVTGLSQTNNADYDFYVSEICGAGDTSITNTYPANVTTPCIPLYNLPALESFDQNVIPPACWTEDLVNGSGWETGQQGDPGYAAGNVAEHTGNGGYFAFVDFSGADDITHLMPPPVDVSSTNNPQVVYWFYSYNDDSQGNNTLRVDAWDGTQWKEVRSHQHNEDAWVRVAADLSSHTFGDTVQLRFSAIENTGMSGSTFHNDILLDDIKIQEAPAHDLKVNEIVYPKATGCDGDLSDVEVQVEIQNAGSASQGDFDVAYSVDGGAPVVETVNDSVHPGNTHLHTFASTTAFAGNGTYDLKVYSELNNDMVLLNDTMQRSVLNGSGTMTPTSTKSAGINDGDFNYEDSLFVCGAQYDVYDCGRILALTIDSLTHEDALDELDIQLVSPEGTTLDLWMQLGAFDEEAMSNLVFTDTASQNITASTGDPHTGIYRPQEAAGFAKFNGEQLNGMWRLRVFNDDCCDTAEVHGWNISAIDPPKPQPDLGSDTSICQEENLLLDPGQDPDWSYVWDNNSTDRTRMISGSFLDTNATYSYHVTVTNEDILNQCSNTDTIEVNVENCTSLEDGNGEDKIAFEVHPNPTSDQLFIQSNASGERFRYDLMDMQGRVLESKLSEADQRSTIDVSSYSKGVYILKGYRESNDEALFQHKVVVE